MHSFILISILIIFSDGPLANQSSLEEVMKLRTEVELQAQETEIQKKRYQSQIDVSIQKEQELQEEILRLELTKRQLQKQIFLSKEKLAKHSFVQGHVKGQKEERRDGKLKSFWNDYEVFIQGDFPLVRKLEEERLKKIRIQYDDQKISYEQAIIQTVLLLDDHLQKNTVTEFLLTPYAENEKSYNLEMIRLGGALGLYRSADSKYGLIRKDDQTHWKMVESSDRDFQRGLDLLLTQFKQQIKTGLYQIPGVHL